MLLGGDIGLAVFRSKQAGGTDSHQGTLQTKGVSKETGTADMGTDMGTDMERGPSKFKDVVVAIFFSLWE